ncbi:hypothetical protein D3C85_1283890 [compost metagenome]
MRLFVSDPDEKGLIVFLAHVIDDLICQSTVVGFLVDRTLQFLVFVASVSTRPYPLAADERGIPQLTPRLAEIRSCLGKVFAKDFLERLTAHCSLA